MISEALNLPFKGARDYLHGTDMIDTVGDCLDRTYGMRNIRDVVFTFNRLAKRALRAETHVESLPKDRVAVVRFSVGTNARTLSIIESDQPVLSRAAYEEERIVGSARLDVERGTCDIDDRLGFTAIETLVAMNKALHLRSYLTKPGNWLFVKLESPRYIQRDESTRLGVQLAKGSSERLTRSTILIDGRPTGYLFFSLVDRP